MLNAVLRSRSMASWSQSRLACSCDPRHLGILLQLWDVAGLTHNYSWN